MVGISKRELLILSRQSNINTGDSSRFFIGDSFLKYVAPMELDGEYLCNNCYQDAAPTELFDETA
jgi:hypothetical protein